MTHQLLEGVKVHPAAELFPMLPDGELQRLAADIAENGLRHPVVVQNGLLIDGRNRLKACQLAKVDPAFEELAAGADPIAYVLSSNLRRNLDASQRSVVAAKLATMKHGGDRKTKVPNGTSIDDAAKLLNVGRMSVARAKHVIDRAAPEVVSAVSAGQLPVSLAAKFVDEVPMAQQAEVIAGAEDIKKAVREYITPGDELPKGESNFDLGGFSVAVQRLSKKAWRECQTDLDRQCVIDELEALYNEYHEKHEKLRSEQEVA